VIQATWIFAFSLIARLGTEGWSAWIVYVLVGVMQVVIIVTAIVFAIQDRQKARKGMEGSHAPGGGIANERSALLSDESH